MIVGVPATTVDPRNAVYGLALDVPLPFTARADVPPGTPNPPRPVAVVLYMTGDGGRFTDATGETIGWNGAVHTVDASGLAVAGSVLTGQVAVTLNADAWMPKDGKPIPCVFQVNASGVYTGSVGTNTESGSVLGAISAPPTGAVVRLYRLAPQPVLTYGRDWERRVNLELTASDGSLSGVARNSMHAKGREAIPLDTSKLEQVGNAIRGELTVAFPGKPAHVLRLESRAIGSRLVGTFQVLVDGNPVGARQLFGGTVSFTDPAKSAAEAK